MAHPDVEVPAAQHGEDRIAADRDHGRDLDWVQGVEIVGDQEPVTRGDHAAVHASDLAAQPSQFGEHFLLDRW